MLNWGPTDSDIQQVLLNNLNTLLTIFTFVHTDTPNSVWVLDTDFILFLYNPEMQKMGEGRD